MPESIDTPESVTPTSPPASGEPNPPAEPTPPAEDLTPSEGGEPTPPEEPTSPEPPEPVTSVEEHEILVRRAKGEDPSFEGIDPDDVHTISAIVDKKTQDLTDKYEVDGYLAKNPEMAKYRSKALEYLKHEAYSNIPVENIMAILSSKEQQAIGAEKERLAQKKAAGSKDPVTPAREPVAPKVDWSRATPEQVDAQIRKVRGQV